VKKKIFSILFALVLALSFTLVTAMPVAATTLTVDTSAPVSATNFHTIQAAVDAAAPTGDTINVAAGTYDEQVVINKSLTLQGVGDTTIIQPSGAGTLTTVKTTPWLGTGTKQMAAIVFVDAAGAQVTIKDLKIDGSGITGVPTGVGGDWVAGLAYLETSGTIENLTVIGNPGLACRTAGIWASAITETTHQVEVTGCSVIGYNRAGIYALGETMTADYHHNEINGPGELAAQVPNGMFFLRGATGSATYNTVTDLGYTGETYRATGIGTYDAGTGITFGHNTISNVQNAFCLNRGSDVTVEYNTVYDCHTGVRLESGTADNILQYNSIKDNTYAIRSSPSGGDNVAHFNSFVGNTGSDTGFPTYVGAVSNVDTTNTLDATYNWWGDCSGPGPVGPGIGDSVSVNVDFEPWLGMNLYNLRDAIEGLDMDDFTKSKAAPGQKEALLDKVDAVCGQYGDGAYRGALNKLERDVIKKLEKWIVSGDKQTALIDMVEAEIDILRNFLQ